MSEEVINKVIPGEKRSTARSAEATGHDKPELEQLESEMKQYKQQDEDVLSYALFPQVAVDFFKYREAQQSRVDLKKADTESSAYPV